MTTIQNKYCLLLSETSILKTLVESTALKKHSSFKMSDRLVESALTLALQLGTFFFDFFPDLELEEMANELKTFVGFMLMAAAGYLLFLNLFFFVLPVAFIFLLLVIGYVLVVGLFSTAL